MKPYRLLLALTIMLAACASGVQPAPSPIATPAYSPSATPATGGETGNSAPTVPATPDGRVAVFPNTIIVYQRQGGIAGLSQQWTFYPTGRVVAGDGTEWQLSPEQVKPLFSLAEDAAFQQLEDSYPAAATCADCITHTLTVYQDGQVKKVTFTDSASIPAYLQQMLNELDQLIAR